MALFVSLLTAGTNSHEETSENANAVATDFVSEGVIGAITNTAGVAPATGAFAANAQGSPNMTVAVSAGVAYVTTTPTSQGSQNLRVKNTSSANVTISSNSSGSTKYDWIYIAVSASNAANPAVNADNVATLVVSRSSSSSSDDGTPPAFGYPLAVVTVANNATSISNGNISDRRELARSVQAATIDNQSLALGVSVQTIYAPFSAVATSTSAIPLDDTEPQISEGFEIMTASITPKSSTNILVVEVSGMLAMSGTNFVTIAIFRDATANALSATTMQIDAANTTHPAYLMAAQVAGSTSSTTFRVRAGRAVASDTITFNGRAGSRLFGNIPKSYIKITEYKA